MDASINYTIKFLAKTTDCVYNLIKSGNAVWEGEIEMEDRETDAGRAAASGAVTSAQMKEIERKADEAGLSYYQMMENAGMGAAEYISSRHPVAGKTVLIFCGKGNNGGDGFVAARKLTEKGALVKLYLAEGRPKTEPMRSKTNRSATRCPSPQ